MASHEAPTYHRFPPEIRNQLYLCSVLPDQSKQQERSYITIGNDGSKVPMDSVHEFYVDAVSASGKSTLFSRKITEVTEIAEEVLTLVTPCILFTFDSPEGLRLFAEAFYAHARICERQIQLHVEIDFASSIDQVSCEAFVKWEETPVPHRRAQDAHGVFQDWLEALTNLPKASTHVHLLFPQFWRDFRSLRGLAAKKGLSEFQVSFAFPGNTYHTFPKLDQDFFIAQTVAAVKGIEVVEMAGISKERREILVRHGCRGFNRHAVKEE